MMYFSFYDLRNRPRSPRDEARERPRERWWASGPVDPRGRIRDLFNGELSTPDAFGGLRRSRTALALVLQGQQNRDR